MLVNSGFFESIWPFSVICIWFFANLMADFKSSWNFDHFGILYFFLAQLGPILETNFVTRHDLHNLIDLPIKFPTRPSIITKKRFFFVSMFQRSSYCKHLWQNKKMCAHQMLPTSTSTKDFYKPNIIKIEVLLIYIHGNIITVFPPLRPAL